MLVHNPNLARFTKKLPDPRLLQNMVYQINVFEEGDQWMALLGDDLVYGYAGFGDTVEEALSDLITQLSKEKPNSSN